MKDVQAHSLEMKLPDEPRIGPGLIIERGRTRIDFAPIQYESHWSGESMKHKVQSSIVYKRWPLMDWPPFGKTITFDRAQVAAALLSGFKVIRQADPEKHNG